MPTAGINIQFPSRCGFFLFRIPDDAQSPRTQLCWTHILSSMQNIYKYGRSHLTAARATERNQMARCTTAVTGKAECLFLISVINSIWIIRYIPIHFRRYLCSCISDVPCEYGTPNSSTCHWRWCLARRLWVNIWEVRVSNISRGTECPTCVPNLRSLTSHRGGLDSVPGQVMLDLWWTKWNLGKFYPLTPVFFANYVSINVPNGFSLVPLHETKINLVEY
jgi:hypothetical protein